MEKEIVEKIIINCRFHEKIIVKLFKRTFVNAYHIGRIECWNSKK